MCICVQARDIGCPRSWSYRKFRATQKECWELNSMVITMQEQSTLLTCKPFLQPHLPFFFLLRLDSLYSRLACYAVHGGSPAPAS